MADLAARPADHIRFGEGAVQLHDRQRRAHCTRLQKILGEEEDTFTFEELRDNNGLLATLDMAWNEALDKVPGVDVAYVNALVRRGEDLTASPRIKLSTIHGAKGGEADNVVLFTDLTVAAERSMDADPDSMHRVFYVAVTRTKKNLFTVLPENFYRSYQL